MNHLSHSMSGCVSPGQDGELAHPLGVCLASEILQRFFCLVVCGHARTRGLREGVARLVACGGYIFCNAEGWSCACALRQLIHPLGT